MKVVWRLVKVGEGRRGSVEEGGVGDGCGSMIVGGSSAEAHLNT